MNITVTNRILKNFGLLAIFGFILLPVLMVIFMSFISTPLITFPPKGYSFSWYLQLFEQSKFANAFFFSIQVSLLAMLISLVLGFFTAIALTRYQFKGKNPIQNLFLSPLVVPAIITGIAIYIFLFNVEKWSGLNIVPSFWSLTMAHVIITIPWTVRLLMAGLEGVNRSLEEAAIDLGANRFQAYWYVIIPSIRPSIVASGIFAFIFSFNNLEISLMLVGPGKATLPIEILNYVFWKIDPLIAAISTIQILVIAVLMIIADKLVGLSKVF
jgi:putative spermidine/putrescine transport system permease protein